MLWKLCESFCRFCIICAWCLKFNCCFKQRNFSWFPTQLVDANKDNFNAQFKTQKESCFNWLEMPLIYFECSKNPYFRINQVVKKGPVLFCFCVQFPGSLPPLKLAEPYKGIENETSFILTELATKHMFDVSCMFSQQYRIFWSSNVVNLVSRKDEGIKPIVFGAFSCRESALKSCARCDK